VAEKSVCVLRIEAHGGLVRPRRRGGNLRSYWYQQGSGPTTQVFRPRAWSGEGSTVVDSHLFDPLLSHLFDPLLSHLFDPLLIGLARRFPVKNRL